jgi:ABC-type transport system involved in cytochrome bd biosynthesis fused ATPase/permease subunit
MLTHRLDTARAADRIAVMADGSVVEQGRHHELLAKNGPYARLVRKGLQGGPMKHLAPFIKLLWPLRDWVALAIFFGMLTLLASIGLLAVSGWFLSASAVAGLSVASAHMFTYSPPAPVFAALTVIRTAGRYAGTGYCPRNHPAPALLPARLVLSKD